MNQGCYSKQIRFGQRCNINRSDKGKAGHSEENGRHERFHLTLMQETASPPAATLSEQLARIQEFKECYNFERPHEALNMRSPGECYTPGPRWNGVLKGPDYDTSAITVRKVGQSGTIWLKQKEYFIGQALTGEYVGLTEDMRLYYGPVELGILSLKNGLEQPKLKKKPVVRRY